ncbi:MULTISPECIES: hypothetical protein [Mesorhizobium]|uniref:Uncharacterized protein n=1 Tax=Mesorhizobium shonense TaxID=1209948 RepID=A0ABV2HZW9_9HYPH|nr:MULTISPECIES: hypothetical protein [unclassified Mesorhizobium]MDX8450155.1 hypothetical protein [Mesorhizobium sp. VK3C]RWA84388.1 MAG: hypothetical protein EOQ30_08650 [Mesorhizobium sp.]RWB20864.1 MAG: hypothetical protein EOQ40_13190 [Mesorhizobium sp.]RWD96750.1 MAG: hypothetical protein EOS40_31510 [Mesorhizobium sp.]
MAVAKKDQERIGYAWMYGAQARKDGKERAVPEYWNEHAEAWLQGFDGVPLAGAGTSKPVSDQLEAEFDEAALSKPGT